MTPLPLPLIGWLHTALCAIALGPVAGFCTATIYTLRSVSR